MAPRPGPMPRPRPDFIGALPSGRGARCVGPIGAQSRRSREGCGPGPVGTGGFSTALKISPERQIAVIVMTNSYESDPGDLSADILYLASQLK